MLILQQRKETNEKGKTLVKFELWKAEKEKEKEKERKRKRKRKET